MSADSFLILPLVSIRNAVLGDELKKAILSDRPIVLLVKRNVMAEFIVAIS